MIAIRLVAFVGLMCSGAGVAFADATPTITSKCKIPTQLACFDTLAAASCLAAEQRWDDAEDLADDVLAANVCNESYRDGAKFFKRAVKAARRGEEGWEAKLDAERTKVADLESRVLELAAEIKDLNTSVGQKDKEIAGLKTELQKTKDKSAEDLDTLKKKLAVAEAEKAALEQKVVEAKLEHATDKATNEKTYKQLNAEKSRVEKKLAKAIVKLKELGVDLPPEGDEGNPTSGASDGG